MASVAAIPRLSDHFPRIEKQCERVATPFFECFTLNSKATDPEVRASVHATISESLIVSNRQDPAAADRGLRALQKCLPLMAAYDKCMIKALIKKPVELYRVHKRSLCARCNCFH